MNQDHGKTLDALVGLRLLEVGRAADMLWMHFGSWREVQYETGTRVVGDWALHIQTPWRAVRAKTILVGSLDMYRYFDTGKEFDWEVDGESRFDRISYTLNNVLKAKSFKVRSVSCDGVGGFTLYFDKNVSLDAFSVASNGFPSKELWRLFVPADDKEHFVVSTSGAEVN